MHAKVGLWERLCFENDENFGVLILKLENNGVRLNTDLMS